MKFGTAPTRNHAGVASQTRVYNQVSGEVAVAVRRWNRPDSFGEPDLRHDAVRFRSVAKQQALKFQKSNLSRTDQNGLVRVYPDSISNEPGSNGKEVRLVMEAMDGQIVDLRKTSGDDNVELFKLTCDCMLQLSRTLIGLFESGWALGDISSDVVLFKCLSGKYQFKFANVECLTHQTNKETLPYCRNSDVRDATRNPDEVMPRNTMNVDPWDDHKDAKSSDIFRLGLVLWDTWFGISHNTHKALRSFGSDELARMTHLHTCDAASGLQLPAPFHAYFMLLTHPLLRDEDATQRLRKGIQILQDAEIRERERERERIKRETKVIRPVIGNTEIGSMHPVIGQDKHYENTEIRVAENMKNQTIRTALKSLSFHAKLPDIYKLGSTSFQRPRDNVRVVINISVKSQAVWAAYVKKCQLLHSIQIHGVVHNIQRIHPILWYPFDDVPNQQKRIVVMEAMDASVLSLRSVYPDDGNLCRVLRDGMLQLAQTLTEMIAVKLTITNISVDTLMYKRVLLDSGYWQTIFKLTDIDDLQHGRNAGAWHTVLVRLALTMWEIWFGTVFGADGRTKLPGGFNTCFQLLMKHLDDKADPMVTLSQVIMVLQGITKWKSTEYWVPIDHARDPHWDEFKPGWDVRA